MMVAAANAKPSPAVGQTLGPLGINMVAFCKEVNERTATCRPEVPLQVMLQTYSDRSYKFFLRTPGSKWFILRCARIPAGSKLRAKQTVGNILLKEIYHIAKAKCMDPPLIGVPLYAIVGSIQGSANAMGVKAVREIEAEYMKRDDQDVTMLEDMKKEIRARNKINRQGKRS